jgi:3-oxoacyl-[acyl-carrier protein] reductase
MRIDLTGRVALVTGAAGELGRPMARTLGRCGAAVAVHYHRSAAKAAELVDELRGAGGRAAAFAADITSAEEVARLRAEVAAELGDPHIVVINAVSGVPWKPVLEQPPEDYADQFRSCVLQAVLLAQAFAPAMVARGGGRIIAINTECAMTCRPGESAYAAAKRGLDGIVRVLARELGPHQITVNQVAPGWMISDRHRTTGTERQPEYEATVPLGRRGEDQEIANAVAFLASDLAGFITGAYLPVCGGRVMVGI